MCLEGVATHLHMLLSDYLFWVCVDFDARVCEFEGPSVVWSVIQPCFSCKHISALNPFSVILRMLYAHTHVSLSWPEGCAGKWMDHVKGQKAILCERNGFTFFTTQTHLEQTERPHASHSHFSPSDLFIRLIISLICITLNLSLSYRLLDIY